MSFIVRGDSSFALSSYPTEDFSPLFIPCRLWIFQHILFVRPNGWGEGNGRTENTIVAKGQRQRAGTSHGKAHHCLMGGIRHGPVMFVDKWFQFMDEEFFIRLTPIIAVNIIRKVAVRNNNDERKNLLRLYHIVHYRGYMSIFHPSGAIATNAMQHVDNRITIVVCAVSCWENNRICNVLSQNLTLKTEGLFLHGPLCC